MRRITFWIAAGLLAWSVAGWAAIDAFTFDTPEQAARFNRLSNELRCLVCQNQTIADSNAELAQDLRREVYGMVIEGKVDAEIIDFLVSRYGDFVLYRPPLKSTTLLLWAGPFVLAVIALLVLLRFISSRASAERREGTLTPAEQARLDALLADPTKEDSR